MMRYFRHDVRFEAIKKDANADMDKMDLGVDYVIGGHNARISVVYSDNIGFVSMNEKTALTVGVQFQI